jgi:IS5 family transposase
MGRHGLPLDRQSELLAHRGRVGHLQRKKPQDKPMPRHVARGDAKRGKVRAAIEHVFAAQKRRLGPVIRTVRIARARAKIGLANLAYNLTRIA